MVETLIERTRLSNVDANVLKATGGALQMPLNVSVGPAQPRRPRRRCPALTLDVLTQAVQVATEAQSAVSTARVAAMPAEALAAARQPAQAAIEARPAETASQPVSAPAQPVPAPCPVALTGPEAANMGSPDPDPAVTAAAERLRRRIVYRLLKRAFDIVFSAAALVCLSWLYLIVAIAIKLDDPAGPVFFVQERVGRNGKRFRMWKFRSMCSDAEAKLAALQAQNEKDGPVFKIAEDPRVTRVGRFIRKTSIDELPQFANVLLGHMSVVGPRPALPKEVAAYTPRQRQRLLVKPGITCYWQTRRNRDAISFDEWVALDLLYIKKCSIWSDFKLITQTIGVVLTAQGS